MPHHVYFFFCARLIFRTNGKFYVCSKIFDVMLLYVTDQHVRINGTL